MGTKLRNKLLIAIFLGFILVVSFGCTYSFVKISMGGPIIITRGEVESAGDEDTTTEDDISLKSISKKGSIIDQEFLILLNDREISLTIRYTMNQIDDNYIIRGRLNDTVLFETIFKTEDYFQEEYIMSNYETDYLQIIKGLDDREYLVMMNYNNTGDNIEYYIFDENMNYINEYEPIVVYKQNLYLQIANDEKIWYANDLLPQNYTEIRTKIDNNRIISLTHVHGGDCLGTIEKRIYAVSGGALTYTVDDTFRVTDMAGFCS